MDYKTFIETKMESVPVAGMEPKELNKKLFSYQRDLTAWAIRRALKLWTNPGDTVLSPFAGIGSEGYVSIQEGRRFVGIELKESYYGQAVKNLESVANLKQEKML